MEKVFYMDDRSQSNQTSLVAKMLTVFDAAGFSEMIKPNEVVAIKLHMGEFNNTAYIRPVYVRALADKIKSLGANPMVVDTTTLPYFPTASRVSALDHINTATRNGFTPGTVGCPIVIADGYIGTDDVRIDLPEGFLLKEQYIATGIALADSMILLSHFKGHAMGTFGGAIKNMGVGCASKRGKVNLHMGGHPKYGLGAMPLFPSRCQGHGCATWQVCDQICPEDAISITENSIDLNIELCTGCLACLGLIMMCGAAGLPEDYFEASAAAVADSALAAAKAIGKERVGYINLAIDVAPGCDCMTFSDRPIVPNLGVFASKDPVALDSACLKKATETMGMPGSLAMEKAVMEPGFPKFTACGSMMGVSEDIQPNVAQKIGLGSREYELVVVPPVDDPTPHLFNPVPIGAKFRNAYKKKKDIYPPNGFKRVEEVDFEDLK